VWHSQNRKYICFISKLLYISITTMRTQHSFLNVTWQERMVSVNCKLKYKCNINVEKLIIENDSRHQLVLRFSSIDDDIKKFLHSLYSVKLLNSGLHIEHWRKLGTVLKVTYIKFVYLTPLNNVLTTWIVNAMYSIWKQDAQLFGPSYKIPNKKLCFTSFKVPKTNYNLIQESHQKNIRNYAMSFSLTAQSICHNLQAAIS
jgi:hypothetical protein